VVDDPDLVEDQVIVAEKGEPEALSPEAGFFNVEKISRHKFQQGWKFLTCWESFPLRKRPGSQSHPSFFQMVLSMKSSRHTALKGTDKYPPKIPFEL
jgi:hypothetical protein